MVNIRTEGTYLVAFGERIQPSFMKTELRSVRMSYARLEGEGIRMPLPIPPCRFLCLCSSFYFVIYFFSMPPLPFFFSFSLPPLDPNYVDFLLLSVVIYYLHKHQLFLCMLSQAKIKSEEKRENYEAYHQSWHTDESYVFKRLRTHRNESKH